MAAGEGWGWSDTFSHLIAGGHSWEEIQHYTLAQLAFFGKAIDRTRVREERTALMIARAAQYDNESFQTFLKERFPDG